MSKNDIPEIHPAVEAENVQARREIVAERERVQKHFDNVAASLNRTKREKRKKATWALAFRAIIAVVWVALIWAAQGFDLIAWEIAIPLECGAMLWFMAWFGAWLQYMFCERGLLK